MPTFPLLSTLKITNEKNAPYPIRRGAPADFEMDPYKNGLLESLSFPGKNSRGGKDFAVFEETIVDRVTILHSLYVSESPREINFRSAESAIIVSNVLQGNVPTKWGRFDIDDRSSGQFNLVFLPKNFQKLYLKSPVTELLEFYYPEDWFETFVKDYSHLKDFMLKVHRKSPVCYHPQSIFGSPGQQFSQLYLQRLLTEDKNVLELNDSLLKIYTGDSLQELLHPSDMDFKFEETVEMARILFSIHRFYMVSDICKKEVRSSFLQKKRFDKAFRQTWDCSAEEYLASMKIQMARKLLDEGLTVPQITKRLGFEDDVYFIDAFEKFHGIKPEIYVEKFEGEGW